MVEKRYVRCAKCNWRWNDYPIEGLGEELKINQQNALAEARAHGCPWCGSRDFVLDYQ